ncbi:spermidine/putrescine ABC transporter permease [Candidatus Poribacteria bacterium]|nr:MAG: spermidine/putrescine ABC transporter permease [Candidatus Poribacteria bacterium]
MRRNYHLFILLFPVVFWLICFFFLPLVSVFIYSFIERGTYGGVRWHFTWENYQRLFDGLYLSILWRSVSTALICTAICLLLGYPFAYYLARYRPKHRNVLLLLVVVPFWTNFLIRTYAWILILRTEGLLNSLLGAVLRNWSPLELLNTPLAVQIGLVYGYLPFMILPLYAALEQLDVSLLEAAQDLGASPRRAFWHVTVPLSLPGILAGSMLVFIPTVGAFLTPDLLGGGKVSYIGNVIERQFKTARDWPFGSALSFMLMGIVLVGTVLYFRALQENEGRADRTR